MKSTAIPSRSKKKQKFFILFVLLFMLVVLESMGQIAYRIYWDRWFYDHISEKKEELKGQSTETAVPFFMEKKILHPYSGVTLRNPTLAMNQANISHDENTIVVGLFGGSVALGVRDELEEQLQALFLDQGIKKDIFLELYAIPGLKQPQQLMQLTYALSIGKKFDIVVNLDGYNEAVLTVDENLERGVFPFFPRLWDVSLDAYRVRHSLESRAIERVQSRYQQYLYLRSQTAFRFSALAGFTLSLFGESTKNRMYDLNRELSEREKDHTIEHFGPRFSNKTLSDVYDLITQNWANSSRLMNHMKFLSGYAYFHFLQPNQYLEGSKRFTQQEISQALKLDSSQAGLIRNIYPRFQSEGKKLRLSGVNFHDLTGVYVGVEYTIYRDACCHVNEWGNKILVEQMVGMIMSKIGLGQFK